MTGTAADDGLPAGSTLSVLWSVASGGAVMFANATALSTTATFGQAGTYTLRLTATDGALAAVDELTVIVQPEPPHNQAPVVNAGSDQAITLPNTASLAATVTDDGLPTGATLAVQWSVDSGGAVTFANANSASTTATFGAAGTYVLRATASDSVLTAFDTVTVIVEPEPPENQAPVVNAGTDQTITLPDTASLAGSATDDGLPAGSSVTLLWSVESGGTVVFASPTSASTTATFAEAGTYVLRLTASDGALSSFDTVTVTVKCLHRRTRPRW